MLGESVPEKGSGEDEGDLWLWKWWDRVVWPLEFVELQKDFHMGEGDSVCWGYVYGGIP